MVRSAWSRAAARPRGNRRRVDRIDRLQLHLVGGVERAEQEAAGDGAEGAARLVLAQGHPAEADQAALASARSSRAKAVVPVGSGASP